MPMNLKLFCGVGHSNDSTHATQQGRPLPPPIVFDERISDIGERLRGLEINISDQGVQQLILKNGHTAIIVMQKNDEDLQRWAKDNMLIAIANTLNEIPHVRIHTSLLGQYIPDDAALTTVFAYVQDGDQKGLVNWYSGALRRASGRSGYKATM